MPKIRNAKIDFSQAKTSVCPNCEHDKFRPAQPPEGNFLKHMKFFQCVKCLAVFKMEDLKTKPFIPGL